MADGSKHDPLYVQANDPLEIAMKDFLGLNAGFFTDFADEIKSLRESIDAMAGTQADQIKSMAKAMPSTVSDMASHANQVGLLGPDGKPFNQPEGPYSDLADRPKSYGKTSEQPELSGQGGPNQPGQKYGDDEESRLPQYFGGKFTAQDFFNMSSDALRASTAKDGILARTVSDLGMDPEALADKAEWMQKRGIPGAYAAKQWIQQAGQAVTGWTEYGESLGVPRSQGTVDVGPMRLFSSATLEGIKTGLSDRFTGAITPGLSGEQVSMIRSNLAELGWYGDDQRSADMNDWGRNITQFSSRLGENPMTYQLMDKAVRHGTSSLEQMNKVIKQIPAAADQANVSWENLMATMDAFGEQVQSTGGTHFTGQQLAQTYATMTDMDPNALMPLQQSPLAQGLMYAEGGVAPWATGTLSPELQASMAFKSFDMMADVTQGIPGETYNFKGFGIQEHNPALEQQAATIAMMTGMDPEVAQQLLKNPKKRRGMEMGMNAVGATRAFSSNIGTAQRRLEANGSQENRRRFARSLENSGKVRAGLKKAINPVTGETMFTQDEIKTAMAPFGGRESFIGWLDDDSKQGVRDHAWDMAVASGKFSEEAKEELLGDTSLDPSKFTGGEINKLKKFTAAERATDAHNSIKRLYEEKTGAEDSEEEGEGKTVVELGPVAQRYFQLQSPQDSAKSYANAGAGISGVTSFGPGNPTVVK